MASVETFLKRCDTRRDNRFARATYSVVGNIAMALVAHNTPEHKEDPNYTSEHHPHRKADPEIAQPVGSSHLTCIKNDITWVFM